MKLLRIVLFLCLISTPMMAATSREEKDDTRWYWRAGITLSLTTFLQDRIGGEGPIYDVSLSERYGKYHGTIYSTPPLSCDINFRLFRFMDLSAGLTWCPTWGKVYDSFDSTEGDTVIANSLFLIPSVKVNYCNKNWGAVYSSIGFGVGFHHNKSNSTIIGVDHWGYHNDYILDKGQNCISKQLEIVLLGFNYRPFFWEGGFGSKFWGYGSRFGIQYNF